MPPSQPFKQPCAKSTLPMSGHPIRRPKNTLHRTYSDQLPSPKPQETSIISHGSLQTRRSLKDPSSTNNWTYQHHNGICRYSMDRRLGDRGPQMRICLISLSLTWVGISIFRLWTWRPFSRHIKLQILHSLKSIHDFIRLGSLFFSSVYSSTCIMPNRVGY